MALNGNLPQDIAILKAQAVSPNFHAQYSTKRKAYQYTILNRKTPCTQQRHLCLHVVQKLNLSIMRKEAKSLIGKKDFRSFMAMDTTQRSPLNEKNTIRTIYRLDIKKRGDFVTITVEANGFLYKMVRNIVGTLLAIGKGQLPQGSMKDILNKKNREFAADTAPAKGLCLVDVRY